MTKPDWKPDHREFRIACDCHEPLHFIQFDWDRWSDGDEDLNAFFCSHRIGGFWKRLCRAFRYVFGTQELITGDIVISKEKARELVAFLSEVAGEPPAFERMTEAELLAGLEGFVPPEKTNDF